MNSTSSPSQKVKKIVIILSCVTILVLAFMFTFGFGALVGQYRPQDARPFNSIVMRLFVSPPCNEDDTTLCGYNDTSDKTAISCSEFSNAENTAILLTFGQSNSGNWGEGSYPASSNVGNFNFLDGQCYQAKDPLLGSDGNMGSVWGRVGDKLIESGQYQKVLVAPFGIGGTAISEWQPDGRLHPRISAAFNALTEAGIEPTHVLWHQGESDATPTATTTADEYTAQFSAMVESMRETGINAPIYPAVATICFNKGKEDIRTAQIELPNLLPNVFPGANTDNLSSIFDRRDFCHFSEQGLDAHAQLWAEALLETEIASNQ